MGVQGGPHAFGREFHDQKLVTGAPYTATVTNTIVQQLAGGNTIQRTTTGQVARDSEGRIYEQQTITGGPLAQNGPKKITFIMDPVAGYSYTLDSDRKTAFRRSYKAHEGRTNGADRGPRGPNPGWHHDESSATEADLSPDSSSGVIAQGKSKTRTIPTGAIGMSNLSSRPVRCGRPRISGLLSSCTQRSSFRSIDLFAQQRRYERAGDASLFQIPAGYTVKDGPAHGPHEGPPPPQ